MIGGVNPPSFEQFLNVEKITWIPKNEDGKPIFNTDGTESTFEFDVLKVKEDFTDEVLIDELLSEYKLNDWEISSFVVNQDISEKPEWVNLSQIDADPETLASGKIAIYTEIIEDADNNLEWLEIHAQDLRENGKGLIGLDLDITWNNERYLITQDILDQSKIFDEKDLPLFQNKGNLTADASGRGQITNMVAAALPKSGTGRALGNKNEPQPQTLFARIPLTVKDKNAERAVELKVNSYPAAAGEKAEEDDLMIINQILRGKVWVMNVEASQEQVGNHLLTIKGEDGDKIREKHIMLTVENTNDAPILVSDDKLDADDLIVSGKEGVYLEKDIAKLFKDEDGDKLIYEIMEGPSWLGVSNTKKVIQGTPDLNAQGVETIRIKAMDENGLSVERELRLEIKNENQSPRVNKIIPTLEFGQEENFIYHLETDTFVDSDLEVEPNEILRYAIIGQSETSENNWLNINESNGTISGRAGMYEVGEHRFRVRATDAEGLYVEQEIIINITNKNDSPLQSEELSNFIEKQQIDDQDIDRDDTQAIFIDDERIINIRSWFADPDMSIDPNETLDFEVYLETDDGESVSIETTRNNSFDNWIEFDKLTRELRINASDEEIGTHYIRVVAKDAENAEASAIVPLNVRWRNRAPRINQEALSIFIDEMNDKRNTNIMGINYVQKGDSTNSIIIELKENSNIEFELPSNMFQDDDNSIITEERLVLKMDSAQELEDNDFNLDTSSLKIIGDTYGKALDNIDGFQEWEYLITGMDNMLKNVDLKITMRLQRSVSSPIIRSTRTRQFYDEDKSIKVSNLFNIQSGDKPDENLYLSIEHKKGEGQQIYIRDERRSDDIDPEINNDNSKVWIIKGSIREIQDKLDSLYMYTSQEANIDKDHEILLSAYNRLGETTVISESVEENINIRFEAVPTTPEWEERESIKIYKPYEMESISKYIEATVQDKKEKITYLIKIAGERKDLVFSDDEGNMIGELTTNGLTLTSEEWKRSVLRSRESNLEQVTLSIKAISTEESNNKSVESVPMEKFG